jgi:hypothetical protein
MTSPDAYTVRGLASLRRALPKTGIIVRTDADLSRESRLTHLLDSVQVDFVRPEADDDELLQRVRRLLRIRDNAGNRVAVTPKTGAKGLMPALHHAGNGRLDARLVAEWYGIPLSDIARGAGRSLSSVHKTPNAKSVQPSLQPYERIAAALLVLAGSRENALAWLNLPEPQLEDRRPIDALAEGLGGEVANLLDDMLLGQPS